jgi:hypothetical protein
MSQERSPQSMKPATAAQKLGVYLPATPEDFQNGTVTRAELNELLGNPPEWLVRERATQAAVREEQKRIKAAAAAKAAEQQ